MTIVPASLSSLPEVMSLISFARARMVAAGNATQWHEGYPPVKMVEVDLLAGYVFLVWQAGRAVATFSFIPGPDSNYSVIKGHWLQPELPYYVIHRLAALPGTRGVFASVLGFCEKLSPNLRVDTHRDNVAMRHLLLRNGFRFCGIVSVDDGTDRRAYQRIIPI